MSISGDVAVQSGIFDFTKLGRWLLSRERLTGIIDQQCGNHGWYYALIFL